LKRLRLDGCRLRGDDVADDHTATSRAVIPAQAGIQPDKTVPAQRDNINALSATRIIF